MNHPHPVPPAPRRAPRARPRARCHPAVRLGGVAHVAPILAAVLADLTGRATR